MQLIPVTDEMLHELERLSYEAAAVASPLAITAGTLMSLVGRIRDLDRRERELVDALIWCSGSPSFQPEGEARVGWVKVCQPLLDVKP